MRIIGGVKRGFPLKKPKSDRVRPTTDKIKEALFNILHSVEGKYFLDLFAGTGSVGLEALSRGAEKVIFIEKDADVARVIKDHIRQFGFEKKAEVMSLEIKKAMSKLAGSEETFDYIFIDPPYQLGLVEKTLSQIREIDLAGEETLIVIQHSKREPVTWDEKSFSMVDCRQYGDSMLTFIKLTKEAGN